MKHEANKQLFLTIFFHKYIKSSYKKPQPSLSKHMVQIHAEQQEKINYESVRNGSLKTGI